MPKPQPAPTERRFTDSPSLAAELALALAARIEQAIAARGRALLAVSGGSSPKPVFAQLALRPLPWSAVTVVQVDERWVDPDHADSNTRLIREHLLVGPASAARFVSLRNVAATPEAGQPDCEALLHTLHFPFDAVLLGMGDDGHTASLFPDAPELAAALDECRPALCSPMRPMHAPHPRMTLTLHALLRSRILFVQIAGAAKLQVFRRAQQEGPIAQMPVRAVLRQTAAPVEIWYAAA